MNVSPSPLLHLQEPQDNKLIKSKVTEVEEKTIHHSVQLGENFL